MNFYETICEICEEKQITLTSLLSKLDMSKANIRNWKNGVIPKIAVRTKIAEITKTPIKKLLTLDELKAFDSINSKSDIP